MNIQEDYVSFEIAKLLKEKGFDEGCSFVVNTVSKGVMPVSYPTTNSDIDDDKVNLIALPTLQMAMKWLREIHKQPINLWYVGDIWSSEIYIAVEKDFCLVGHFQSYEEAVEAAIKYCLEHLI